MPQDDFENAKPSDWRDYIDEKVTFFRTDLGGRIVKLRVHFKPRHDGYITWYLAVRQTPIEHENNKKWTTPWPRLEDWEQLGILSLLLSHFCIKKRYMNRKNFVEIQNMKRNWESLVKEDFEGLKNKKAFIAEIALKLRER
ncbi:MAG: hypothetical protein NWF04_01685 [Candidatus Bathyarchaeota archaeon]|nr:hypothetical protein [Candidatus Bathyarchaeota archaeon]